MRDTNALRADGPDNWSILCYGREGGYDYEGTRSVVQNGRFTFRRDDTRAVAMFGCLQVDRHYLSCPLIRYLFTCFEPILRCGGGRAAGMEVCCGVVWCSPQIIKFQCNRVPVRLAEDGRSACEYCRRYGRYLLPPTRKLFVVMRQTHRRILYERREYF